MLLSERAWKSARLPDLVQLAGSVYERVEALPVPISARVWAESGAAFQHRRPPPALAASSGVPTHRQGRRGPV